MSRVRHRKRKEEKLSAPAEAYRAFRTEQARYSSAMRAFIDRLSFAPDDYQIEAMSALDAGANVLVAAPTGAGKTLVADYAIAQVAAQGGKLFYTTPIKALSNQKYRDFCAALDPQLVGLATGDVTINAHAPVVVMTTEVLRNLLYRDDARIEELRTVVMDEVHYLADHFRGPVWEEVIIHLPERVRLIALSATVSNAEEFGEWLQEVRGDTRIVVSEYRPVPLESHMAVGSEIYPLYADGKTRKGTINRRLIGAIERAKEPHRRRRGRGFAPARVRTTSHRELVEALRRHDLLPAIDFIFSRAGCDAACQHVLASGVLLTSNEEARIIREHVAARTRGLSDRERDVLNIATFAAAAEAGVAAHHAGMLPLFKEIVEELFTEGLLKLVFATETLSLGINMPARSVVIESLLKWNGAAKVPLSAGQYTQLTGRAGRRGLDTLGHAIVLYAPQQDPHSVAALASKRTYPLRSAFHPTYNMVVNLLGRTTHAEARSLMERSFAQFQADRSVVQLASEAAKLTAQMEAARERMSCSRGDFAAYSDLVAELKSARRQRPSQDARAKARTCLEDARVGDVIAYRERGRPALALVVEPSVRGEGFVGVLTSGAQLRQVGPYMAPIEKVGRLDVSHALQPRKPRDRQRMASQLRRAFRDVAWETIDAAPTDRAHELERKVEAHPCHTCPHRSAHQSKARGYVRAKRRIVRLEATIERKTSSIGQTFDRVATVLQRLGYLHPDYTLTSAGELLSGLYAERDLLVAQCLASGAWDDLDAPALAGAVSACVYSSRNDEPVAEVGSVANLASALARTQAAAQLIDDTEAACSAPRSSLPDASMATIVALWAKGESLTKVLSLANDMPAGDFVRLIKQVIDALRQIAHVHSALAPQAHEAIDGLKRGVVSWGDIG
ncbi:MAG: DEAD/DEAH box helicase [Actinomycetaceae bacterium]|nr:DEAD/DEAH box helicase [Actinomycetaceae bacterium]